jgi:hypothetical protein
MVGVVLVHHRIHDVAHDHSLDVVEQDVNPHAKNCDGEAVANKQDRFVLKCIANGNCGNNKTGVRKDHGPPTQVEVQCPLVNDLSASQYP